MSEKGMTLMGTGESKGENRAEESTRKALTSPLLDNISINGATGVLYNITASSSLSLKEIGRISDIIKESAASNAKIKFGIVDDDKIGDMLRVTVIATGFKKGQLQKNETQRPMFMPKSKTGKLSQNVIPDEPVARKEENQEFGFKKPENTVNLTDLDYINERNIPSMAQNPEDFDDILEVPSFQRPKVTEK
jgi:cell division GTPase FtsZ